MCQRRKNKQTTFYSGKTDLVLEKQIERYWLTMSWIMLHIKLLSQWLYQVKTWPENRIEITFKRDSWNILINMDKEWEYLYITS